jgi:hypothetical protein
MNVWDQASRYAAKRLDAPGFIRWLLRPPPTFSFPGWLDTRTLPFPGEPDRICDTVACFADEEHPGVWWAIPVEFGVRPQADLFGRLLIYLGHLWLEKRPTDQRGERYSVGAAVVNLTGRGRTSRDMDALLLGIRTCLQIAEHNLEEDDAAATLAEITADRLPRCVLPWIPLMQGGGDPANMARWKELAQAEPDSRLRGDYGGLALVFAEAVGRRDAWKQALEGWNVVESVQVREWMAEGEARGKVIASRALLQSLLEDRFGPLPEALQQRIVAIDDVERLQNAARQVHRLQQLDELQL